MARYLNSCGMGQVGGYGTRSEVMSRSLVGQGSAEGLPSSTIRYCCCSPTTAQSLVGRSSNFDIAVDWVREIVVLVSELISGI